MLLSTCIKGRYFAGATSLLCQPGQILIINLILRNEHRFLLAGLKIEKLADWAARQAAYAKAAKDFLIKLKPEFSEIEVKFVRGMNVGRGQEARLILSVDCGSVEQ